MKTTFDLAILILYVVYGAKLSNNAYQHFRDKDRTFGFTPIYNPEVFTPEGNRLRMRALRFYGWGLAALIIYFVAF